jgi:hypothetical protein
MRISALSASLAIGSLLQISAAGAAGPIQPLKVGNWSGGSFTNDQTGAFSHCAASAPYTSGITLFVSVNSAMQWSLGFASTAWKLVPGETIPLDLTFDSRGQYHVFAHVVLGVLAEVPMPDNSALIRTFRQAKQMQVFAKGQLFAFNLNTTAELLPALVACVRTSLGQPVAPPLAAIPPKKAAPPVGTLAPSAPPAAPQSSFAAADATTNADVQIEAINLATSFMLKSQLQNPQLLSRSNTPTELASWGAAWKADDAVGAVKIVPAQEGMKGIDLAAAVAATDAKECKGKFLSGRTSDLVDSDVVFRGFATCEDSEGTRSSLYFIVPRKKGGFVLFSVLSNGKPDTPSPATRDQKLTDYRKAALASVSD